MNKKKIVIILVFVTIAGIAIYFIYRNMKSNKLSSESSVKLNEIVNAQRPNTNNSFTEADIIGFSLAKNGLLTSIEAEELENVLQNAWSKAVELFKAGGLYKGQPGIVYPNSEGEDYALSEDMARQDAVTVYVRARVDGKTHADAISMTIKFVDENIK